MGGHEQLARKAPEIPGEPEPIEDRLIAVPRMRPPVRGEAIFVPGSALSLSTGIVLGRPRSGARSALCFLSPS
jgi:hypothetical protein